MASASSWSTGTSPAAILAPLRRADPVEMVHPLDAIVAALVDRLDRNFDKRELRGLQARCMPGKDMPGSTPSAVANDVTRSWYTRASRLGYSMARHN